MSVSEVASNFDTTTPVPQSNSAVDVSGTATSLTDDLASTPDNDSILICAYLAYDGASLTRAVDTGWTALHEPGFETWFTAYADGSNGTQYGGSNNSPAGDSAIIIGAIEVQPSAASSTALPLINAYYG